MPRHGERATQEPGCPRRRIGRRRLRTATNSSAGGWRLGTTQGWEDRQDQELAVLLLA